jgi:hypothetical protein
MFQPIGAQKPIAQSAGTQESFSASFAPDWQSPNALLQQFNAFAHSNHHYTTPVRSTPEDIFTCIFYGPAAGQEQK